MQPSIQQHNTSSHLNISHQDYRKSYLSKLIDDNVSGVIDRANSLISAYKKKKAIDYQSITLTFKNVRAVGNGVAKDALSQFFDETSKKWEGCSEVVPAFSSIDLELIGKIAQHAFLLFEIFPSQFSRASLKYYLFDKNLDNKELLDSFFKYLPEKESDFLQNFDSCSDKQACVDILSEFRIFDPPKTENINDLCLKGAHIAIIQKPCFQMQQLVAGMNFFREMGKEFFDELYHQTIPSADKLIASIIVEEKTTHEQNITTWLHRYIRSCSHTDLKRLLRFVTASTSMPSTKIKLQYVNQQLEYLRPITETCFCILNLPRQYESFFQLRNNLNQFIQNSSNNHWQMEDD